MKLLSIGVLYRRFACRNNGANEGRGSCRLIGKEACWIGLLIERGKGDGGENIPGAGEY